MKTLLTLIATLCAFASSGQTLWLINNTTNSPDSLRAAFSKVNSNSVTISNFMANAEDADTNAIVRSGSYVVWSTNVLNLTNGVRWTVPVTITNPAGMAYTLTQGDTAAMWVWAGTTNWDSGALTTTGAVEYSFYAEAPSNVGTPVNPVVSNITVYAMERPDLFGRTNLTVGQTLEVVTPTGANQAANKGYVDTMVAGVNYMQNGGLYLSGSQLNLNSDWSWSGGTNGSWLRYLGVNVISFENPTLDFGTITSIRLTNTTVWVRVWTNGVTGTLVPHWTYDLVHPTWAAVSTVTNSYPTADGTNYLLSFPLPNQTKAFIRVAKATTGVNVANLSALLSSAPRTITNATDTTWGKGSGLLTWDTNYLYISVGSNQGKRAALSTW
jgi:hypothetical protein